MRKFKVKNFIILLLILSLLPTTTLPSFSQNNNFSDSIQENIPFDGFFMHFHLKIKRNLIPLPNINLTVNYSTIENNSFDLKNEMGFRSSSFLIFGYEQENATFYENTTNRMSSLYSFEGLYINWLLDLIYNSSQGADNSPFFWINTEDLKLGDSIQIFQYKMQYTNKSILNTDQLEILDDSTEIIIFNTNITQTSQNVNTSYNFGLIYDNYTGILLKGKIIGYLDFVNRTDNYYLDFELIKTNVFDHFPIIASNEDFIASILPKPNYLLFLLILLIPILIFLIKYRIKEVEGGLE